MTSIEMLLLCVRDRQEKVEFDFSSGQLMIRIGSFRYLASPYSDSEAIDNATISYLRYQGATIPELTAHLTKEAINDRA